MSSEIWSLFIVSVIHVHVNVNFLFPLQNVIMLNVQTVFQQRVLVETNSPSEVQPRRRYRFEILPWISWLVQVGNNNATDWLVFALEHNDLSKIIVNSPTVSPFCFKWANVYVSRCFSWFWTCRKWSARCSSPPSFFSSFWFADLEMQSLVWLVSVLLVPFLSGECWCGAKRLQTKSLLSARRHRQTKLD